MQIIYLSTVLMLSLTQFVSCQNINNGSVIGIKCSELQNSEFEYLTGGGKWFIPHNAGINITFKKDSTFVFNDFNTKKMESEVFQGTFELNGKQLILKYNNRPAQTFNFEKGKGADDHYYITKGKKYYFVRGSMDF